MQMSNEGIVQFLGIPWKRNPSVKRVPRNLWGEWNKLPQSVETFRTLLSESSRIVVQSYNKLKPKE